MEAGDDRNVAPGWCSAPVPARTCIAGKGGLASGPRQSRTRHRGTTAQYDAADRLEFDLAPLDRAGDPQGKTSYTLAHLKSRLEY
jgi:hypothetical protein